MDEIIEISRKAVNITPKGSPDMPSRLDNLGNALRSSYDRSGKLTDLVESIEAFRKALSVTPESSPAIPVLLNNLAISLIAHYLHTGDFTELEESINSLREALRYTLENLPERASRLSNLSVGLRHHFLRTGELADLMEAIDVGRKAVKITSEVSPGMPSMLHNLASALSSLYGSKGELSYLDEAIEMGSKAVRITPKGSSDLPSRLSNLGIDLKTRYDRTGDILDLEKAIDACRKAVDLTGEGSSNLPGFLLYLGMCLSARFSRIGDFSDLDEAIETGYKAISNCPKGSVGLSDYLNNLGNWLSQRYGIEGNPLDLKEGIGFLRNAVALTPPEAPSFFIRLSNLSRVLIDLYVLTGDFSSLEEAIESCKKAVSLIQDDTSGRPYKSHLFINLGKGLIQLYARNDNISDLDEAIETWRIAASLTSKSSPDLPTILNNLGIGLRMRYDRTVNLYDLEEAFYKFDEASSILRNFFSNVIVSYKFGVRREWSKIDDRLVETALQLMQVSADDQRFHWGQEAIIAAEGSKSRLLTELLGRCDIPSPPTIPLELAAQETKLISELIQIDTAEFAKMGLNTISEEKTTDRMALIKRREELVRQLNDFWRQMEDYGIEANEFVSLRRGDRLSWNDLYNLAKNVGKDTALISLYALNDRLVLFILRAEWKAPKVLEMPLNIEAQEEIMKRFFEEVNRTGTADQQTETWQYKLLPIFETIVHYLERTKQIVFAPEGFGHRIPWQVVALQAGINISWATIPCLGSLARLWIRSRELSDGPALVVGNPTGDLLYKGQEAKDVARLLKTQFLIGSQATKEAVLERLPEARIAHFDAHAYFDDKDPLNSGISLADGDLKARDLMEMQRERNLRLRLNLLVLSACETGITMSLGGDEMAGLPQAFLQAGARSLLVSLWRIDELSTSLLVQHFYQELQKLPEKKSGQLLTKAEALLSAQQYIRDLTAQQIANYCDKRLEDLVLPEDIDQAVSFQMTRAKVQALAGDIKAAINSCNGVRALLDTMAIDKKKLIDQISRKVKLLELKSEVAPVINYEIKPYESSYYWGSYYSSKCPLH